MAISDLIGCSPKFQSVLDQITMVAPVECAVMIQGETGTGKEVIAKAIHDMSARGNNRFVAVNCAAIPSALLESELFGHERGAFTGAVTQTTGRFQAADRGTLFLDEIGDLPLELQPKLLRVLQEQQIERLGGGRTVQLDVRVVAATHQDLWQMVEDRKFRADLYYRLNVFPIMLPPLRERRDDIPALAEHFVRKFAARHGRSIHRISDELLNVLKRHEWPGNIRELQNFIERAVIMTTGSVLHGPVEELSGAAITSVPPRTLADADRTHIRAILRETNWVVGGPNGAAARLGLPRTTLLARMRKLGISQETFGRREGQAHRPFATVPAQRSHLHDAFRQADGAQDRTSDISMAQSELLDRSTRRVAVATRHQPLKYRHFPAL